MLDDVVALTINTATVFPTRLGFGVPMVLGYHAIGSSLRSEYRSLQEMVDAGFAITSPVYLAVGKILAQNPRPARVIVGKRAGFTQIIRIIPVETTVGYKYIFTVVKPDLTESAIEYTVATGTVAAICTGLQAVLDPLADIAATDDTTHVTLTVTANKVINIRELPPIAKMKVKDMTAAGTSAADLAAVQVEDNTSWYGLTLDRSGEAEINAIANAIESERKIFIANNSDSEICDPLITTDVASDIKGQSYARTALIYIQNQIQSYAAQAWIGGVLPTDPGATTWVYRTLRGVTVDTKITGGNETALTNKYVSYYTTIAGKNVVQGGKTAAGEFIDVIHFVDKLYARIRERIFGTISAAADRGEKIPYTDDGVDTIRSCIYAELADGIRSGGLRDDPAPIVTAPKVADISLADRAGRTVPDIEFSAELAGAIHSVSITGTLSV